MAPKDYSMNNPAMTVPASGSLSTSESTDPAISSSGETKDVQGGSTLAAKLTKYEVGWRRIVRNFSPSWFSVTMGTGIVSVLLISIPYQAHWLYWLSVVFFVLNIILFTLAFVVSALRYGLYPEIFAVMIHDPVNSLFLGTIPMGFATIIEMVLFACVPHWGPWAVTFVWVLWMVDVVAAVAVTIFLSYTLISSQQLNSLERITAAQLLPIAATIVAAGTGSEIAAVLPNPQHALGTVVTCYVLWGMGVPLAMTVLVLYYHRLAVHKLPPREIIVSSFLPLGPLGFGGYTITYLGKVCLTLLPKTNTIHPLAGPVLYVLGLLMALIMWGFGLVWLGLAVIIIAKCRPFPFNMGWWGFTFPLGVFAASTIQIGLELPSKTFRILGTILAVAVILLWIVVAAGTARGAWSGRLFFAPCLANLKPKEAPPGAQSEVME